MAAGREAGAGPRGEAHGRDNEVIISFPLDDSERIWVSDEARKLQVIIERG